MKEDRDVWGAVFVEDARRTILEAGIVDLRLESRSEYFGEMAEWSDPFYRKVAGALPEGTRPGDFLTRLSIAARKP
jgi:hypothetical protein